MVQELFSISKVIYCYKEMWIIKEKNDQTYMLLAKCILKDATVSLYTFKNIKYIFCTKPHTRRTGSMQKGRE